MFPNPKDMKFTKEQVSVIWSALTLTSNSQPKSFALAQLKDASEILAQIKKVCVDGEDKFMDGELEFSTDQKKLIRDSADREWPALVGGDVVAVREMLA